MPLFQGTVLTNTKQSIPAFYALIDNEQFEGFDWLIGCIEQARQQHDIEQPRVNITDYEDALRSALKKHMPEVPQQLYIFHVNANIVLNVKRKWKKPAAAQNQRQQQAKEQAEEQAREQASDNSREEENDTKLQ